MPRKVLQSTSFPRKTSAYAIWHNERVPSLLDLEPQIANATSINLFLKCGCRHWSKFTTPHFTFTSYRSGAQWRLMWAQSTNFRHVTLVHGESSFIHPSFARISGALSVPQSKVALFPLFFLFAGSPPCPEPRVASSSVHFGYLSQIPCTCSLFADTLTICFAFCCVKATEKWQNKCQMYNTSSRITMQSFLKQGQSNSKEEAISNEADKHTYTSELPTQLRSGD